MSNCIVCDRLGKGHLIKEIKRYHINVKQILRVRGYIEWFFLSPV